MGGGMQMGNLGMNNMGFDPGPDWAAQSGPSMGGPGPALGGMGGVFFSVSCILLCVSRHSSLCIFVPVSHLCPSPRSMYSQI